MNITFGKTTGTRTAILANGTEVGYIEKHVEEVQRMIPGTNLRYAKGRTETRYSYTIVRRNFTDAPMTAGSGTYPLRSLGAAKAKAADEVATYTLKG